MCTLLYCYIILPFTGTFISYNHLEYRYCKYMCILLYCYIILPLQGHTSATNTLKYRHCEYMCILLYCYDILPFTGTFISYKRLDYIPWHYSAVNIHRQQHCACGAVQSTSRAHPPAAARGEGEDHPSWGARAAGE